MDDVAGFAVGAREVADVSLKPFAARDACLPQRQGFSVSTASWVEGSQL